MSITHRPRFRLLSAFAVATLLAVVLVGCSSEPSSAPMDTPHPTSTAALTLPNTTTAAPTNTPTPMPEPTPVVLGDCRDGMRLQPGEGCRYTGGGSPQANVVLSVQHDGAICREGGPVKQEIGGVTLNVGSLRLCGSDGFERDDAFQSEIVASANADGSWTFYESVLSASRTHANPDASGRGHTDAEPNPVGAESPSADRAALIALYNATDGENWDESDNWLSEQPILGWHGVITDRNGRVTVLRLRNNTLSGEIPAELGSLSNLTALYLNGNELSGKIPAELGSLSNLTALYLNGNELSGCVPRSLEDQLDHLGGLLSYC